MNFIIHIKILFTLVSEKPTSQELHSLFQNLNLHISELNVILKRRRKKRDYATSVSATDISTLIIWTLLNTILSAEKIPTDSCDIATNGLIYLVVTEKLLDI